MIVSVIICSIDPHKFAQASTDVARALRFDDATFDHFHLYDLDFSFRAFLEGYRLAVCRPETLSRYIAGVDRMVG